MVKLIIMFVIVNVYLAFAKNLRIYYSLNNVHNRYATNIEKLTNGHCNNKYQLIYIFHNYKM